MPLTLAIELLNRETNSEDTVESLNGATPKSLTFKIDQRLSQLFIDSLTNDRDKARFLSVSLQHSGDFLNTIPSPILGLHLDKRVYFCAEIPPWHATLLSGWNMSIMFRSVRLHGRPHNYMNEAW